jgi:hypothetical protein
VSLLRSDQNNNPTDVRGHMIALPNARPDWPTSIKQAVGELLLRLSDANKDTVRNTAEADLPMLGSNLGTAIRCEFGLWDGNTALLAACGSPDMPADSASVVIIRALWQCLRNE